MNQFDSDDEREAAEVKEAYKKKLVSQVTKKAMKNTARLPRTAGLRTLSELTTEMTKAGLDPSRIQERAEMLAKVQGAKRKREREEEDAEMDVDGEEGAEGDWMDVDEDAAPAKRVKSNSGGAVAKGRREPASNRQFAGMRDEAVSVLAPDVYSPLMIASFSHSKHPKLSNYGISARENATCMLGQERATAPSRSRW